MKPAKPQTIAPAYALRHGMACAGVSVMVGLTQGRGLYLVSSNLSAIQGSLGATAAEASWLTTAYFATALSAVPLLTKFRMQFGLRTFANLGIAFFLAMSGLHLLTQSVPSAVAARAALGLAAAPLSALAVLYMVEAFPQRLAGAGLVLGFATLQLGSPLSRVVSEDLLQIGQWTGLFLIDVALAMLSFGAINAVQLAPVPRQKAFSAGDLIAFPLYASGLALLCVAVTQGRLRWWTDTDWLGVCLAGAIACIGLYVLVELHRKQPMFDLRWLTSPFMLRFVVAILLFRIALAEQTNGVVGLMTVLGLNNDQMHTMFLLVLAGTIAGFMIALVIAARKQANLLSLLAVSLIIVAAWMDSDATALTRPPNLYFSQTLLASALAVFMATSVIVGFGRVVAEGMKNIISFVAAFAAAQYLGSLLGAAWITTAVADRQQLHYAALAQHLSATDPQVAARLSQLAGSVGGVVSDPAARALQGMSLLAQQVTRESFVLAYNDVFQLIAALAAGMLFWLACITIRAARRPASPSASAGGEAATASTSA
jgi:MFS family permease